MIQLTLIPRRCTGMEAFNEGADDVGVLAIAPDHLVYNGDAISFSISRNAIKEMTARNLGWRALWIMGNGIDLALTQPLSGFSGLTLAPRQDATLPDQLRAARQLESSLRRWLDGETATNH